MAETLYLFGVDPHSRLSIHSTPAISTRFGPAATYDRVRHAVDDLADGRPVKLHTDSGGVERVQRVVAELVSA